MVEENYKRLHGHAIRVCWLQWTMIRIARGVGHHMNILSKEDTRVTGHMDWISIMSFG